MYRIRTDDLVDEQVAALPHEGLTAYTQVLGVLELVPWNGKPYVKGKPHGNMRRWVFGPDGQGLVIYLILEDQGYVDVLEVIWIG